MAIMMMTVVRSAARPGAGSPRSLARTTGRVPAPAPAVVVGAVSRGSCVSHMHAADRGGRPPCARWDRRPAVSRVAVRKTIARMHLACAGFASAACARSRRRSRLALRSPRACPDCLLALLDCSSMRTWNMATFLVQPGTSTFPIRNIYVPTL